MYRLAIVSNAFTITVNVVVSVIVPLVIVTVNVTSVSCSGSVVTTPSLLITSGFELTNESVISSYSVVNEILPTVFVPLNAAKSALNSANGSSGAN